VCPRIPCGIGRDRDQRRGPGCDHVRPVRGAGVGSGSEA
jgi:hypothetical protein